MAMFLVLEKSRQTISHDDLFMRLAFLPALIFLAACGRVAKTRSDPLPHDVYVWQREAGDRHDALAKLGT